MSQNRAPQLSTRAAYLALAAASSHPQKITDQVGVSWPVRALSAPPRYARAAEDEPAFARSFSPGSATPRTPPTVSFASVQPRRIPVIIFLVANFFGALGFIAHGIWDSFSAPPAAVPARRSLTANLAGPLTAGSQGLASLLAAHPLASKFLRRENLTRHDERLRDDWLANVVCPRDFRLDKALAICTALDQHRSIHSIADLEGHANENGAYSRHNQKYDATGEGKWYIEEQYYGFLFIQAGLAFNNSEAARIGMKIFYWGFDQQRDDGTFDCPDVYHSAGFFMESAARAALLLKSSKWAAHPVFNRWLRKAKRHVAGMAAWFADPTIEERGWKSDALHAHRRYLTGTALGMAGLLTGNQTLIQKSVKYVESGLEMQDSAGFNYERNGFDCSYQGIGLMYIARYYLYVAPHIQPSDSQSEPPAVSDAPRIEPRVSKASNSQTEQAAESKRAGSDANEIRARLLQAGKRGAAWLVTRVGADGRLNATGNTRTGHGQEVGRNGKPKALARKDVFHALLYWGWILGDPTVERAAWLVERERTGRARDRRCDCKGGIELGEEKPRDSASSSE